MENQRSMAEFLANAYVEIGAFFASAHGGHFELNDGLFLGDAGAKHRSRNMAVFTSRPSAEQLRALSSRLNAFYNRCDGWVVWSFWEDDLSFAGLTEETGLPVGLRAPQPIEITPSDINIVEVKTQDQVELFQQTRQRAWGVESLSQGLSVNALGPNWRMWIAYVDDQAAGTAAVFLGETAAMLKYVSTHPQFVGTGIATTLSRFALSHVGNMQVVLDSTFEAFGIYERLRFEQAGSLHYWHPSKTGTL